MSEIALQLDAVASPCVQICKLDDHGMCIGCFRTGEEIAAWLSYSDDQRAAIMSELPSRGEQRFDDS
jgi:hypothetical protein